MVLYTILVFVFGRERVCHASNLFTPFFISNADFMFILNKHKKYYLYNTNELDGWVKRIKELGNKSEKVLVITNNHYRGQALANALQIKNKITDDKLDIPLSLLKTYPHLKEIAEKIKSGQYDLFPEE